MHFVIFQGIEFFLLKEFYETQKKSLSKGVIIQRISLSNYNFYLVLFEIGSLAFQVEYSLFFLLMILNAFYTLIYLLSLIGKIISSNPNVTVFWK